MSAASVSVIHSSLSALCHRYRDRPAILVFWSGGVHVTVTTEIDMEIDTADASAEELARAVEEYAAATEWRRQAPCSGQPAVTA